MVRNILILLFAVLSVYAATAFKIEARSLGYYAGAGFKIVSKLNCLTGKVDLKDSAIKGADTENEVQASEDRCPILCQGQGYRAIRNSAGDITDCGGYCICRGLNLGTRVACGSDLEFNLYMDETGLPTKPNLCVAKGTFNSVCSTVPQN